MSDVERFVTESAKQVVGLAKDDILAFYQWTVNEGDTFTKKQKSKVDKYLEQLATGVITPKQLAGYLQDIKTLTEMQLIKIEVKERAEAQKLIDGVKDLLIGNLLKLL